MATMYPKAKFRYKVEIDGMEAGGFSEVTGGDITIEPIEYREGDMPTETPIKVVGLKKYGNITLKQGMTDSRVLYEWLEPSINGDAERKTVTITQIQREVERFYDISHEDLVGAKRNKEIMEPRHIAIYLARELTETSLEGIGEQFGGRSHATIIASLRKVDKVKKEDKIFHDRLTQVLNNITGNA